jgi:hypothetical protein
MGNTVEQNSDAQDSTGAEFDINEARLRAEIGFWRELIDSCDEEQPPDSIERMNHALALAELRLAHLFETYQKISGDGIKRPSNVFFLEEARRTRV